MIESMTKPVGDHLWQRGTNCGGVSCPGGQVAVLQVVRGTKYGCCNWSGGTDLGGILGGRLILGGTGCSMTVPENRPGVIEAICTLVSIHLRLAPQQGLVVALTALSTIEIHMVPYK